MNPDFFKGTVVEAAAGRELESQKDGVERTAMATIIADAKPITDKASKFSVRDAPLLSEGQTMTLLAEASDLKIHLKVHAPGWNGELVQHHHPHEDHMFFVLAGEATFKDEHGKLTRVGAMEGIMLPKARRVLIRRTAARRTWSSSERAWSPRAGGLVLMEKDADMASMQHVINHYVAGGAHVRRSSYRLSGG